MYLFDLCLIRKLILWTLFDRLLRADRFLSFVLQRLYYRRALYLLILGLLVLLILLWRFVGQQFLLYLVVLYLGLIAVPVFVHVKILGRQLFRNLAFGLQVFLFGTTVVVVAVFVLVLYGKVLDAPA